MVGLAVLEQLPPGLAVAVAAADSQAAWVGIRVVVAAAAIVAAELAEVLLLEAAGFF